MLTTSPSTWYSQWKQRNRRLPDTRAGYLELPATYSGEQLLVGGFEVMQAWERPLMRALAEEAARSRGHVLEVGFGMGISATFLIEAGCTRYTVIEPHRAVLERFRSWQKLQPVPVQVIEGFWEDRIDQLGLFDGILFDTYPVSEPEAHEKVYVPFIPKASEHLRPGGVFTFYTGYADALPPAHMELLRKHFSSVRLYHVEGLEPPKDCQYFHHSRMVVPVCTK
jgi:spermidine synthase